MYKGTIAAMKPRGNPLTTYPSRTKYIYGRKTTSAVPSIQNTEINCIIRMLPIESHKAPLKTHPTSG